MNFHPATPKYGGIGGYNFAIYNEDEEYGVLCHEMTKKIDTGKIIKVKRFPLNGNETVMELKEKSMKQLLELFHEIIDIIKKDGILPVSNEKWSRKPYTREEFQQLCRLSHDMPREELLKRIRATYYPEGPDYPYFEIEGKKIPLKEISLE